MNNHPNSHSASGQPRQPQRDTEDAESNDFERSEQGIAIDDPGDAQRSSKSEPDGDGEEESS